MFVSENYHLSEKSAMVAKCWLLLDYSASSFLFSSLVTARNLFLLVV